MNEPTFGPYTAKGYNLAPLTLRRYQHALRVFSALPINDVAGAFSTLQSLATASAKMEEDALPADGTEEDLEVNIDLAPLYNAITKAVVQADDQNILVELAALALDIPAEEAADLPYDTGQEVIGDFFTANPKLLTDTLGFFTRLMSPGSSAPRKGNQKPRSMQTSTPSPPPPEQPAEEIQSKKSRSTE